MMMPDHYLIKKCLQTFPVFQCNSLKLNWFMPDHHVTATFAAFIQVQHSPFWVFWVKSMTTIWLTPFLHCTQYCNQSVMHDIVCHLLSITTTPPHHWVPCHGFAVHRKSQLYLGQSIKTKMFIWLDTAMFIVSHLNLGEKIIYFLYVTTTDYEQKNLQTNTITPQLLALYKLDICSFSKN